MNNVNRYIKPSVYFVDLGGVKSYSRKVRTEPVTIKDIRNVLKR